jgi:hypothetical protein
MNSEPSFWRRQFVGNATTAQVSFDVVFGITLPIVCLVFDPIVFHSSATGVMHDDYKAASLLTIFIGIGAISLWLATGRFSAVLSGILALCGCFAALLGFVLLPLSILGTLFAGIGLLGFTPFLTAFVFARNAVRAWSAALQGGKRQAVTMTAMISFILIPVALWGVESYLKHRQAAALAALLSEDYSDDEAAIGSLDSVGIRYLGSNGKFDEVVRQYEWEESPARRERLAAGYLKLTGDSIEDRLFRLND